MIRDPPWRITDWQSQKREKLKYISRSAILKYGQERGDDWKRLIGTYYSILPQCNRKIKNLNTALYSIALEKQLLEKYTKNIFAYLVLCDKFHIMNHLCVTSVIDYCKFCTLSDATICNRRLWNRRQNRRQPSNRCEFDVTPVLPTQWQITTFDLFSGIWRFPSLANTKAKHLLWLVCWRWFFPVCSKVGDAFCCEWNRQYYLSVVIIWKIQSVVVELINEKSIERKLIVAVTRIRENYIKFTKSFYRTKKKVLFNVLA